MSVNVNTDGILHELDKIRVYFYLFKKIIIITEVMIKTSSMFAACLVTKGKIASTVSLFFTSYCYYNFETNFLATIWSFVVVQS